MINYLDYEGIKFPVRKEDFSKIEKKNNICINVICYENKLTYPVYISNQMFKNCMDFLMNSDEFLCLTSKVLIDLCVLKQSVKEKTIYCLQCFSSERVLREHKKVCLIINGKQTFKLRSGSIKFKNL